MLQYHAVSMMSVSAAPTATMRGIQRAERRHSNQIWALERLRNAGFSRLRRAIHSIRSASALGSSIGNAGMLPPRIARAAR